MFSTKYIDKVIQKLEQSYKVVENIIDELSKPESKIDGSKYFAYYSGLQKINSEHEELLENITLSILSGEYYSEKFKENKLIKIKELFNKNIKKFENEASFNNIKADSQKLDFFIELKEKKYFQSIHDINDYYLDFSENLENSMKNEDIIYLSLSYQEFVESFNPEFFRTKSLKNNDQIKKNDKRISEINLDIETYEKQLETEGEAIKRQELSDEINKLTEEIRILNKQRSNSSAEIFININQFIVCANLVLAQIDEGYITNNNTLLLLIRLAQKVSYVLIYDIKNESTNENLDYSIRSVTLQKCEFLMYKLLYRYNKTDRRNYAQFVKIPKESLISDGKQTEEYSLSNLFNKFTKRPNVYFDKYKEHIRLLFDKVNLNNSNTIIERINKICDKDYKVTIADCHFLFKYSKVNRDKIINDKYYEYKDFIKKLNSVESLLLVKLNEVNEENKDYDYYAYKSGHYLIVNAIFILEKYLKIKNLFNPINYEDLLKFIDEISEEVKAKYDLLKDIKNSAMYYNYHASFQFSRQLTELYINLLEELEKRFDDIEGITNTETYNKLIKNLNSLNKNIYNYIDYSLQQVFLTGDKKEMTVYLLENESFTDKVKIKGSSDEINLIIDSTYILPANYKDLNKKLLQDIEHLRKVDFGFRLATYNKIINLQKENINEELNTKFRDNQLNAISIIGLFFGVIVFTLGSISIIPKFEGSYLNILLFLFVFSSGILLFAFALRFLFLVKEKSHDFYQLLGINIDGWGDFYADSIYKYIIIRTKSNTLIKKDNNIETNESIMFAVLEMLLYLITLPLFPIYIFFNVRKTKFEFRVVPIFFYFFTFIISVFIIWKFRKEFHKTKSIETTIIKEYYQTNRLDTILKSSDTSIVTAESQLKNDIK